MNLNNQSWFVFVSSRRFCGSFDEHRRHNLRNIGVIVGQHVYIVLYLFLKFVPAIWIQSSPAPPAHHVASLVLRLRGS